jgi:flagellar biosynthesis protein FliP
MRALVFLLISAAAACAKPAVALVNTSAGAKGAETFSIPMQVVLLLTALTVLPAILVSLTPFLRIVIVLHFLRQALGTQSTPSNQVLIGLAMFLTMLIVKPVAGEVYANVWTPLERGEITTTEAWERVKPPVSKFLLKYTREKDLKLFVDVTKAPAPRTAQDLDLSVIAPAYMISELKTGFQIGAVLFLPFLIVDLAVSSLTLAVGMVQLPPALVSAPFKIMLFVLIDGWNLLIGSLVKSF